MTHIIQILHLALNMFLHYSVKLDNYNCYGDFNSTGILHFRPQNSDCKIWGRLNSSGLNPTTIKSWKQCSSV